MIFSVPFEKDSLYYYYRQLSKALADLPPLEGVALLPVDTERFTPQSPEDCTEINIGVYLPDNGLITSACIHPTFTWDLIIVPAYWLEYQLKIRGITNVVTITPGYDISLVDNIQARLDDGRFIVASSGRMTLHLGHDLVLCVMKQFMARHLDCWFAVDWILGSNAINELRSSPCCTMDDCVPWDLVGLLATNGIDPARILKPFSTVSIGPTCDLVASADVYLSLSRVSLGIDDVSAAFHIVGKPIIAFQPPDGTPQLAPDGTTVWFEPVVNEVLEQLEVVYTDWLAGNDRPSPVNLRSWTMAASELYATITDHFKEQNRPVSVFSWNKRGVALAELGFYHAAQAHFQKALTMAPLNPETYNCLGNLMAKQERHQEAILYFDKAISLDKKFMAAFFNKGTSLKDLKSYENSILSYQKALQICPLFDKGWLNLAVVYALNGQEDKSEYCFKKTLEIDPGNTDALFLWGNQLLGQQAWEKAIDCYEQILEQEPEHYLACNSMGIACLSLMEAEKAYAILSKALAIKPDLDSAMTNIGTACRDMNQLAEAIMWYEKALSIDSEAADTHWNYSLALLHTGDYKRGWLQYEWRFKKSDKIKIRESGLPLWDGKTDLTGKSILLQAEQGYGDAIQFLRYATELAERGVDVTVEFQDANIQSIAPYLTCVVDSINWSDVQPVTDFRFPLMSLPFVLGATLESIPKTGGYLFPSAQHIAEWQSVINKEVPRHSLRIGIVWDGRKTFRNDKRSIPLEKLIPLFEMEDVAFLSIQKGEQAIHLQSLPKNLPVHDFSEQLTTFADTAAFVAALDLIICVDTSVAHLAGAVGCPTWVMLKTGPDWRWLENRDDSPWYASVKLYRQSKDGDWDTVIDNVRYDLVNFIALKKN